MDFWKMAYEYKWCTLDQLREACDLGGITKEEFKKICGQDFDNEEEKQ